MHLSGLLLCMILLLLERVLQCSLLLLGAAQLILNSCKRLMFSLQLNLDAPEGSLHHTSLVYCLLKGFTINTNNLDVEQTFSCLLNVIVLEC